MLKRALIAVVLAAVVAVGLAIPALAASTQSWEERRIATEAFDSAADSALDASDRGASATNLLDAARESAGAALESGTQVAAAASGYFTDATVSALTSATAALDAALAAEAPDGPAMPDTERPESIGELNAATAPLEAWASGEKERAAAVAALAAQLDDLTATVGSATLTLATSVSTEASAALAAAPLASADSRTAVEKARDAVLAATEFAKPLGEYTSAVAALRASQKAAVDAAAAAASESDSTGSSGPRTVTILGPPPRPAYCDIFQPVNDPACS